MRMTREGRSAHTLRDRELVRAAQPELPAIRELAACIAHLAQAESAQRLALVGPDNERIPLPESVYRVLRQVVEHLSRGESVSILHTGDELTSQQAADLLNVSRPYMVRLLDRGEIPSHRVGTHRRIRREDLEHYQLQRDRYRRQALRSMVNDAEELGLYEVAEVSAADPVEAPRRS